MKLRGKNSFIHLCRVWFQSCLSDGAAPMASESGGRDNRLPQGLMGAPYLGLLCFMAVFLCESRYSSFFLSFFLSAGLMAFQLSPSLRADRSWPRVPRCVCMGFFFHVHMVHRGPYFCAHCEAFNRVLHTVSPPVGYNFWTGTRNGKKCHRRLRIRIQEGRNTGLCTPSACSTYWSYIKGLLSLCTGLVFFLPWVHLPLGSSWKRRKAGPSWKDWPLRSSPP